MPALLPSINSTIVLKKIAFGGLRAGFRVGGWLLPSRTLRRAADLFGTPLPATRARAAACDPAGAVLGEIRHGTQRIATYTWGDPARQPTVLLAHGWSSYGLFLLPWVRPLRDAGYAVVAFDQPGHGRSDGRRSSLPEFAAVLRQVADHHGAPVAVVAHSLGGAATMLALAGGWRTGRVVLVAPPADPVAAGERFARFVGLPDRLAGRLLEGWQAQTHTRLDSLQAHRAAPRLAVPALLVHDLGDREVPWAEGERYARHWPGARLLTTEGLGHNRIATDPGVIAAALDFLGGAVVGERVVSSPNLPYGFA